MAERNIDVFAARLGDPNLGMSSQQILDSGQLHILALYSHNGVSKLISGIDPKLKLNHAMELRDNVEFLCAGSIYPVFLRKLMPIFKKLLEGPPVFISTSWVQVWPSRPKSFQPC